MAATDPTLGVDHPTVVPGNPRPVEDGVPEVAPADEEGRDGPPE